MKDSQKYSLNPDFKTEKFDNEILLYAVAKSRGIYLNETAYLVWEMCGRDHSAGEIIAILEETYPQQKATIRGDIDSAIESLVENGALIAIDE